ncbi:MAG: hypothetical protein M0Z30_06760 [Actinomycetota bacterium]|nr:hypothetical protein [Actinomycetota bacterium]
MSPEATKVIGLDPTSPMIPSDEQRATPRARPSTLDGAVVGLVANGLGQSERLLQQIYEMLAGEYQIAGVVPILKHSVSVPPEADDWTRITSEATVAITGFGG